MVEVSDELDALKRRIHQLEADAARHLVTQRDLNRAKDQLDIELARLTVMQTYIGRALADEDEPAFLTTTLETVIETFEYEVALFLSPAEVGETAA